MGLYVLSNDALCYVGMGNLVSRKKMHLLEETDCQRTFSEGTQEDRENITSFPGMRAPRSEAFFIS